MVGNAGTGTVTLNSGATVTADRLQLAQDVGSTGTLTLSGVNTHTGTTTISAGTLALDATGALASSSNINLGTTGSTGTLDVTAKSSFTLGSGQTLSGVDTVSLGGDTLTIEGTFSPGNSAGLVTIDGNFTLDSASIINLEIGGLTRATEYDAFDVTGTATLGGTLNVSLIDEYNPTGTSTYNLFNASSIGGTFAAVNLPSVANGTWNTSNLATTGEISLTVSAVPEPANFALLLSLLAIGVKTTQRRVVRRRS